MQRRSTSSIGVQAAQEAHLNLSPRGVACQGGPAREPGFRTGCGFLRVIPAAAILHFPAAQPSLSLAAAPPRNRPSPLVVAGVGFGRKPSRSVLAYFIAMDVVQAADVRGKAGGLLERDLSFVRFSRIRTLQVSRKNKIANKLIRGPDTYLHIVWTRPSPQGDE
jgi:hypothetical protein